MMARRGFTLLEMLVASTIMAVAIVGLLSGIGGATRNAARLRDYDRAAQLGAAENERSAGRRQPRRGSRTQRDLRSHPHRRHAGRMAGALDHHLHAAHSHDRAALLQRIELQIRWTAGEQHKSFTLDAYRTHILRAADL
jgi:general secretion pathway protein I